MSIGRVVFIHISTWWHRHRHRHRWLVDAGWLHAFVVLSLHVKHVTCDFWIFFASTCEISVITIYTKTHCGAVSIFVSGSDCHSVAYITSAISSEFKLLEFPFESINWNRQRISSVNPSTYFCPMFEFHSKRLKYPISVIFSCHTISVYINWNLLIDMIATCQSNSSFFSHLITLLTTFVSHFHTVTRFSVRSVRFFILSLVPDCRLVLIVETNDSINFCEWHSICFLFSQQKKKTMKCNGEMNFRFQQCSKDFAKLKRILTCIVIWLNSFFPTHKMQLIV